MTPFLTKPVYAISREFWVPMIKKESPTFRVLLGDGLSKCSAFRIRSSFTRYPIIIDRVGISLRLLISGIIAAYVYIGHRRVRLVIYLNVAEGRRVIGVW